jgi:hypothetical protein
MRTHQLLIAAGSRQVPINSDLRSVVPGSDEALAKLLGMADVLGIDAPLGWPAPYVKAITRHHAEKGWPETDDPVAQRRLLCRGARTGHSPCESAGSRCVDQHLL